MIKTPLYEFHVLREARDYYGFDETFFAQTGNVIFSDMFHIRLFAQQINSKRDLVSSPDKTIKAGALNAMGLIDEILHYMAGLFKRQKNSTLFKDAEQWIIKKIGSKKYKKVIEAFVDQYPPLSVYRGEISRDEFLKSESLGINNRHIVLEELLLLHLANDNPAFHPFKELFDDKNLSKDTDYRQLTASIRSFLSEQPTFGPDHQSLYDMLKTPALKFPHSLSAQLEFIREHWGYLLSDYIFRLLGSLDLIKEEEKAGFTGPGPTYVPDFSNLTGDDEPERFSADQDWMPNVVMIAKSTYVWLDQLSRKYSRSITKLDHIPDEELDLLASRGFTTLWLIGLWERSSASQKIKQLCGNPEAVSSAYSLYDYNIATDLGGDAAYENLRSRSWKRGIRLASDMVPNHTGIYSKWVIEHPEWYIQADNPIFPGYTFNGNNLSDDDRVAIYIEDGYWNRSDAAVLFKRVDTYTGAVTYIYHGNDGTSMPWNDTAQLNYLLPEVREAVIQTILHVARKFPIIRLDAAMTLAKKHFQRLWFPPPGSGGDIPSRSGFALTREQFDQAFPVEFWREVVDRVAQEVPDTLLLAEAFWMMEGYFVRSLGMHRVYNSAFMNMLKNEENAKYRDAIKSVMDFNPEIMKRYVNFINNPDEETAVAQFGKDDKYFGVSTLMCTLPGLPMFGHGQIEGYSEKYGMEYKKAYWDEQEDGYLIERHEREIFPLLKRRYLFSHVQNFILYDLIGPDGYVNEDVYAFSNRAGDEKAVVLFNNRYERSSGWIKYSSASAEKNADSFKQFTLSEGLSLAAGNNIYIIFRDQITNLEYIRHSGDFAHHGLYVELDGFKYHVFLDFREVQENEYGHYGQITEYLSGKGVPGIEAALKETFLKPVHQPFNNLMQLDFLNRVDKYMRSLKTAKNISPDLINDFKKNMSDFIAGVNDYISAGGDEKVLLEELNAKFRKMLLLYQPALLLETKQTTSLKKIPVFLKESAPSPATLALWLIYADLGKLQDSNYAPIISLSWLDEFFFYKLIVRSLQTIGHDELSAERQLLLIKCLILLPNWMEQASENKGNAIQALFQYQEIQQYLNINQYHNVLYFHLESLIELVAAMYTVGVINLVGNKETEVRENKKKVETWFKLVNNIITSARENGSRVYETITALSS